MDQMQCIRNLSAVLEEAGSSLHNVVRVGVFLTDMSNFAAMNKVYETMFKDPKPVSASQLSLRAVCLRDVHLQCRTCVAVKELPMRTDVEIECIAHL